MGKFGVRKVQFLFQTNKPLLVQAEVKQYVKTHVDGHLKTSGPHILLFDVHGR